MSDFEGDFVPPFDDWDMRPDDIDFDLDPQLLGVVPLTDDGHVYAYVYADQTGVVHDIDDFDLQPLEDLLGLPHDDDPGFEILDFVDYVPQKDDDLRMYPNLAGVQKFLKDTNFYDTSTVYYDSESEIFYVLVDPSP